MYRKLNANEIESLQNKGCSSTDWSKVEVSESFFDPSRFYNVEFSGIVKIGSLDSEVEIVDGVKTVCCIKNLHINNSTIGDRVYINTVWQSISNMTIEDDVIINNVTSITATNNAKFGNGTIVNVLDESGGRKVAIFDKLSSQLAYIIAMYRHENVVVDKINSLISSYTERVANKGGVVGKGSRILNCGAIKNVRIGQYATIKGVTRLFDGTVNSTFDSKTYVGDGVIADHFIFASSSHIFDGALIEKSFIGEGCEIGKQFSAENSLFFANCIAMHGEAVAMFAGPFSVTHHKSTLLIAFLSSFMNAGSNSNQSNHMYKLGPIHQGILDRGAKLASGSYLLWPMRVGAFSVVLGKHKSHADLSNFPYSYIIEGEKGETILSPATNYKSIGTVRDVEKWPKRDKRGGCEVLDQINFSHLNPVIVQKMMNGRRILSKLINNSSDNDQKVEYNGCIIKRSSALNGFKLYNSAITIYIGNMLKKQLENIKLTSDQQLQQRLLIGSNATGGEWVDLAGMLTPKLELNKLFGALESDEIESIELLHEKFIDIHKNYATFEWSWVLTALELELRKDVRDITIDDIASYMKHYEGRVSEQQWRVTEDSKKEFSDTFKTGFGIDSDLKRDIDADFEAVRADIITLQRVISKTNI